MSSPRVLSLRSLEAKCRGCGTKGLTLAKGLCSECTRLNEIIATANAKAARAQQRRARTKREQMKEWKPKGLLPGGDSVRVRLLPPPPSVLDAARKSFMLLPLEATMEAVFKKKNGGAVRSDKVPLPSGKPKPKAVEVPPLPDKRAPRACDGEEV